MTVRGARVNVTNQPTQLSSGDDNREGESVLIRNRSGVALDVGGPDVVSGAGFELLANEDMTVDGLLTGNVVYAVGPGAGPYRVDVLRNGVA